MSYLYPTLLPQLQFLAEPAEYRKVSQERTYQQNAKFWEITPVYTFAYCPLCGKVYQEAANTYEFKGWGYKGLGKNLYASDEKRRRAKTLHSFSRRSDIY